MTTTTKPATLAELRSSGWVSKTVKREIYDNFLAMLASGDEEMFPGIIGYDDTVIPEINIALLAGHDMLFLGEKGQAKSRLMRSLVAVSRRRDSLSSTFPSAPLHDDPYRPISSVCRRFLAEHRPTDVPIAWWPREQRYAERLAPGTKFADIIGEIDPSKLAGGTSMSAEEALHFGLIPRMHRGIFAMNELPELDELVQVGMFNILEERDVQIRGYPVKFDIDLLILFSANPATYNRSGKVIPQLKDRIGSVIHTHYPRERELGIQIMEQEAASRTGRRVPGSRALLHARDHRGDQHRRAASRSISTSSRASARGSASPTIARWSPSPGIAARCWASGRPCRGSATWAHLYSSSLGKLELDMMGSHQMSERQVLDADHRRGDSQRLRRIRRSPRPGQRSAEIFSRGVKIEVGDLLPSQQLCRPIEARAPGLGQSLRGQRIERRRPCGLLASSSCWPGCTPPTASRAFAAARTDRVRNSNEPQSQDKSEGMAKRRLGGMIHTYQKYDPQSIPSPNQPPPDLVSPAFEHMLAYGGHE